MPFVIALFGLLWSTHIMAAAPTSSDATKACLSGEGWGWEVIINGNKYTANFWSSGSFQYKLPSTADQYAIGTWKITKAGHAELTGIVQGGQTPLANKTATLNSCSSLKLDGYTLKSTRKEDAGNMAASKSLTFEFCKCLFSKGNSPFMKVYEAKCDREISKKLGVPQWTAVNMSQNPVVDRKFDQIVAACRQ
jgi:hypothetical protein